MSRPFKRPDHLVEHALDVGLWLTVANARDAIVLADGVLDALRRTGRPLERSTMN
jgi:hypothetical protein